MYQYDDPTAVSTLPTPAASGTAGFFTDGSAGAGEAATILRADFMNTLMMELVNLVTAAGLTLSKTNYTQVLASIRMLIQNGAANYGVDTGAANAYAVSYAIPVTAVSDGEKLRFKALHANTSASTFTPNPGTIAPAAIWGGAHAALQGGEIAASGDVEVTWNASLNTTGVWVLTESSGGALQIPPGSQPDQAVQLAQLTNTASPIALTTSASVSANQAVNQSQVIGVGQTLTNVTVNRAGSTVYTNTTGKPIFVYVGAAVTAGGGSLTLSVGNATAGLSYQPAISNGLAVCGLVPAGSTYQVGLFTAAISSWYELR